QARRCTVLLEIGVPSASSEAGAPSSPLRPSTVVWTLTCGRTPLRRGSRPWSMAWCASSTRASARRCLGERPSSSPSGRESESTAVLTAALAASSLHPLLEVADHRGGRKADLARAQGFGNPGHHRQLLAHAEPVGGGVARHLTAPRHPAHRTHSRQEVVAPLASPIEDLAERALQPV